jgi:hypothetical protein
VVDEYKEQITFQTERDLFVRFASRTSLVYHLCPKPSHSVISSAITTLLRELESTSEPSFAVMARTAWPTLNQVSGQSAYVAELVMAVEGVLDAVKPLVEQKKYLRNLFDKASR